MNVAHYFIDKVNVTINGKNKEYIITGSGAYEPKMVVKEAINMAKEDYPNSEYTAKIISHENVTLEEFQEKIGKNPPWLGNIVD